MGERRRHVRVFAGFLHPTGGCGFHVGGPASRGSPKSLAAPCSGVRVVFGRNLWHVHHKLNLIQRLMICPALDLWPRSRSGRLSVTRRRSKTPSARAGFTLIRQHHASHAQQSGLGVGDHPRHRAGQLKGLCHARLNQREITQMSGLLNNRGPV